MAYGDFKDLFRRTASDKILRDEAFNIAKYLKFDRYQRGLVSMVYELFDKKNFWWSIWKWKYVERRVSWKITQTNYQKYKKRRVHSSFTDNIWRVDLVDMKLISKFN